MKRASGLLLHITSLPSPYGVGTLGKAAFDFVDYLHRARQRYWQILPLTPTGYGDSPYQSASTFAGNPYLVDLDLLKEQGLLTDEDIGADWGGDPRKVDFGLLYNRRRAVLEKAFARFDRSKMADYVADHAWYLKDQLRILTILINNFPHVLKRIDDGIDDCLSIWCVPYY